MTVVDAAPGLSNVSVAHTAIGDVRGEEGFYHYRQHSAIELARTSTFEAVWYLFVHGRLPDDDELRVFAARVRRLRELDDDTLGFVRAVATGPGDRRPLIDLRTTLSAVAGMTGMAPLWDSDPAERVEQGIRLCAMVPTILAAAHRLASGLEPCAPRADLDTAAYWLYAITGEVPSAQAARAIEQYLIATVDHGFNASTFTARVIASTGADLPSALCGAIGAFSGPLHGGAPDRALDALDTVLRRRDQADGAPLSTVAREWAHEELASGRRIMGFGHAVYRTRDPRSELLRDIATALGGDMADAAVTIEREVLDVLSRQHPERPLSTNVEYYAGVVMDRCGLPRAMFTPTFTVSRVLGWTANVLEQAESRKIIRPRTTYVGPPVVTARQAGTSV